MLVIRGSCFDSHFEGLELCNLTHFYVVGGARTDRRGKALTMAVVVVAYKAMMGNEQRDITKGKIINDPTDTNKSVLQHAKVFLCTFLLDTYTLTNYS